MAQSVQDVMTLDVLAVDAGSNVREAAQKMNAEGVGDVVVLRGGKVCGIVTDRDITVRVVAEGNDPTKTKVGDICSAEVVAISPNDSVEEAVTMVREHAVRRIPVVDDGGTPVGIVSLGDLAMLRDPSSALADVSAAPPNI